MDFIQSNEHLQFSFLKSLNMIDPINERQESQIRKIDEVMNNIIDNESENDLLSLQNFCGKVALKKNI